MKRLLSCCNDLPFNELIKYLMAIVGIGCLNFLSWNFFGLLFIFLLAIVFRVLRAIQGFSSIFRTLASLFLLAFVVNSSALFWLFEVGWTDAVLSIFGGSILMTIPLIATVYIRYLSIYIRLLIIWPFFELWNEHWLWAWPWLTFGNVLGGCPILIQWYAITGTIGGTVWLIGLGALLESISMRYCFNKLLCLLFALLIPISISILSYYNVTKGFGHSQILIHTTDDSYQELNQIKIKKVYNHLLLAEKEGKSFDYFIAPEVFLHGIYPMPSDNKDIQAYLEQITNLYKNSYIIIGADIQYENLAYNGVWIFHRQHFYRKVKGKLVPLREYTPSFLAPILGQSTYSLSKEKPDLSNQPDFSLFICYESIFSTYVAKHSYNSTVILLLASERFMNGSYFGERQYLNILRIRAIENQKTLIKASNGGQSCVINKNGELQKAIKEPFDWVEIEKYEDNSIYQQIVALLSEKER